MSNPTSDDPSPKDARARQRRRRRKHVWIGAALLALTAIITFGVTALLVTIFEHQQEARTPFVRLVDVDETTTDPVPWGANWPFQFDTYRRSVDLTETRYGGSSAMPASKLEAEPWLRRLYAGYAFSLDYREARGHAYMLFDQEVTERVTKRTQSGACLHCHASVVPTYRRLGMLHRGEEPTPGKLAADFNWPAVLAGFRLASTMTYAEAHAELLKTPDGTPGEHLPLFPGGSTTKVPSEANAVELPPAPVEGEWEVERPGEAHPVSCVDCHEPKTMAVRVTRPAFVLGIAKLADSGQPLPHLPSIERWRESGRDRSYDPNIDASRAEMRSFVCAQCHVEYYCATKETLFFPWERGLKAEQIEKTYDKHRFPNGEPFHDYLHGETGAPAYKAQHPEFEMWNQGVHARSGVSCADCHMPYERKGAMKVSSHWVRSPLLNVNNACQTCHNIPESELREKVATIQGRTQDMLTRAAAAMTDMLDAIRDAQAAGKEDDEMDQIYDLQKKATWRLDFVSSENSMGFHADQETARILAESIDYSRQAQALAVSLRAPEPPSSKRPVRPVEGVTPTEKAPPAPHKTPPTRSPGDGN